MANVLDKLLLSKEHREGFKQALVEMIDKQFDTFQDSFAAAFKSLPYGVLESMTEKEAYEFVSLTVKEAVGALEQSMKALGGQVQKTVNDPERMEKIKREFMERVSGGGASADIPDVPKNTMEDM